MEVRDVSEVKWGRASRTMDEWNGSRLEDLEEAQQFTGMPRGALGGKDAPRKDLPQDNPGRHGRGSASVPPRLIPALDHSVQLPSFSPLSVKRPPTSPPFGKRCTPSQVPVVNLRQYGHPSYDRIHELCKAGGLESGFENTAGREGRTLTDSNDIDISM